VEHVLRDGHAIWYSSIVSAEVQWRAMVRAAARGALVIRFKLREFK
jgi:hypothetical protein